MRDDGAATTTMTRRTAATTTTTHRQFVHWVEYASNHTTNLAPGLVCNWWMAYLNFQVRRPADSESSSGRL